MAALAVGVLGAAMFLPHAPRTFLADDWFVLEAASEATAGDIAGWLDPLSSGWFRPISLAYFAASWRVFGLSALHHHALAAAIYAVTVAAVGVLGMRIYGEPWMGPAAAAAFGVSSAHAEPVLWTAAANELLAGLWFVAALLALAAYLRERRPVWLLPTGLAFVLAIGSKETALALPIAMLAMQLWLPGRLEAGRKTSFGTKGLPSGWRAAWVVAAVAALPLIAVRARIDLPYAVSLAPGDLVRNMAYSAAMIFGAIPADAREMLTATTWAGRTATIGAALAALGAVGGLVLLALLRHPWRDCSACRPATAIAAAILVAGLLPPAPIVSERTAYVASIGGALLIAGLATRLLRVARRAGRRDVAVVVALFAVYLGAHATAAQIRADAWRRAGIVSERVLNALAVEASAAPVGARLVVLGLPDRVDSAYAFRNAFPSAARLWPIPRAVEAHLDTDGPAGDLALPRPMGAGTWAGDDALRAGPVIVFELREGPPVSLVRRTAPREGGSR